MSSLAQEYYSPAQYLNLERSSENKNEYINGHVYAMTGASREHNLIAGNVFGELRSQLKDRPCEVFTADMRVKVSSTGMYTYPDVTGACGPRFEDEQVDTLVNPAFIVEVLSPSTEAYDRGEKFAHYRRLETLQEYVLVAQDKVRVEHFARYGTTGEQWVLTEISDLERTLHLASIGCDIALREIYSRIEFA